MQTIKELFARTSLEKTDARVLMAHVCQTTLNWPKSALLSRDTDLLPQKTIDLWLQLENRRIKGEPVAYLIGYKEFHEITLEVGPGVLIPRPETELLVEIALTEIKRLKESGQSKIRILDLGTGSGAIALALANIAKPSNAISNIEMEIVGIDQSLDALNIAKRNSERLQLNSIVSFYQGNWYSALNEETFQIILSNPPYIPAGDPHLAQGDLRFEPPSALTDHKDGLQAYREIIGRASDFLVQNGLLAVEHGYDQKEAVQKLFVQNEFKSIQTLQDLASLDRVTLARVG